MLLLDVQTALSTDTLSRSLFPDVARDVCRRGDHATDVRPDWPPRVDRRSVGVASSKYDSICTISTTGDTFRREKIFFSPFRSTEPSCNTTNVYIFRFRMLSTIPDSTQGGLILQLRIEGHGGLHWNRPLRQKCLHWFDFTPVIPSGTRVVAHLSRVS